MLKRGNWSVEELGKLRAQFARRPIDQLARDLRRSEEAVRDRAARIFSRRSRPGELDGEDEAALREMVGVATVDEMALAIGRDRNAVVTTLRAWASRTRSGRYLEWEQQFLKDFGSKRPDWALQLVTGRSLTVINKRRRELCLGRDRSLVAVPIPEIGEERVLVLEPAKNRRMPRWKPEDVETLRTLYPVQSNLDVARVLGRSVKSVRSKAQDLGLRKSPERLEAMGRENVKARYQRDERRS